MRILIAEDDPTSRLALTGLLSKCGFEVAEAADGHAAWMALEQPDPPRLMILDWMMPALDGLEIVRRVRARKTALSPYILMLTARGNTSDLVIGLDAGADDYLVKPFHSGELLARIRVGCRLLAMQDELAAKMAQLQKSEEKHRVLLEKAAGAVFCCTPEGQCEYANTTFAREIGRPAVEIVGTPIRDIFSPEEAEKFYDHLDEVTRTGEELAVEINHWSNDGDLCRLRTITPIMDGAGRMVSVLFASRDITERKRSENFREMGRDILQKLNDPVDWDDTLRQVLELLKNRTGFDTSMQLKDQSRPLPHCLAARETVLAPLVKGLRLEEEKGPAPSPSWCDPILAAGRIRLVAPQVTPAGSVWANETLPLPPADNGTEGPDALPLGGRPYASAALIPIRSRDRMAGVLHFYHRRRNSFTPEIVESLENIASLMGAALLRRQAEEALQAEQKRLTDIIEFLPDPTLALDSQGRILIWNRALERMTGVPAEEMLGKGEYAYSIPFYGVPRPQLINLVFSNHEEIAPLYPSISREGEALTTEVYCEALNNRRGGWVFAKASPLRDRDGNIIGAIESIREITYKKQIEDKLKKHISWYQALFNATSDSVILIRPDGEILDLNNIAALRRNLTQEKMRGRSLFDFLPEGAGQIRKMALEHLLNDRSLIQYDENRGDKHYRIRLFPITDEQGKVIQVANFSRDITENKLTEAEKEKLQAQLIQMQKMEALGTLAGGIAHDFNNLLGAILGYAEMARNSTRLDPAVSRNLDMVLAAGDRASALVKQILTFSRKNDSERLPLHPGHMVKETLRLLQPSLPSTIAIKKRIEPTTQPILADPTQFQQILMNLCINAFHAMEQTGGELDIEIRDYHFTRQELKHQPTVEPGRFVGLTVRDSGQGIRPDIRHKIFDPYFTTKQAGKGTGMGLAIVHGLVTGHGGFIDLESEPGKGSAFHVYFPAAKEEIAASEKYPPASSPPMGKERILLVDDEHILAELGKAMLEHLGYQVTARTSSLEAFSLFQSRPHRFDAVITDQNMPGMTGSRLAERMLQLRPDLPIILCTGNSSAMDEGSIRSIGVREFLMKPVPLNDLALLLRKVLDD